MKNRHFVIPLITAVFGLTFAEAQEPLAEATPIPDYVRYRSAGEEADVLETAVSRFQKGDHVLDLIAVVHLADGEYFKRLKQALTPYDAVYYELVGGPYTEERASTTVGADEDMSQIHGLQQMATRLLGLEFQLDGLDYLAPNFVHADMTEDQAPDLSAGFASEPIQDLLTRAMKIAQSGTVPGMPSTEADANRLMTQVMGAALTGNSNQLKRSLGPILGEAESFISALENEGEEGTILISKRNAIVIDKINETVASRPPGPKTDAVLYGAGHMMDLEDRLVEMGYTKTNTVWQSAWVIDEGANRNQKAPSLDELMKQIGDLMGIINSQ